MSAFEINTANEDLSTVSDSLRTIIDASTNIFMNTLATNFGMSNASSSYLEPYIPAILYTLYDGYYISAPTRTPIVLTDSDGNAVSLGDTGVTYSASTYSFKMVHTNLESQVNCTECVTTKDNKGKVIACTAGGPAGNKHIIYDNGNGVKDANEYSTMSEQEKATFQVKYEALNEEGKKNYGQLLYLKKGTTNQYTTNVDEAELEIKHVLKTYMPYSARYKSTNFDIVAIYTLDNYLSIEGTINDIYYTKSGYFIPDNSVEISKINGAITGIPKLLDYNQNDAKKFIEDGNFVEIKLKKDGTNLSSGNADPNLRKSKAQLEERLRVLNNNYSDALKYIAQLEINPSTDISVINGWTDNTGNVYAYTTTDKLLRAKEAKKFLADDMNNIQYQLDEMSAVSYYVTAQIFSNWIYKNLVTENTVRERDLIEISGQEYKLIKGKLQVSHDFESDSPVFNIVGTDNTYSKLNSPIEIDKDSTFYSHKLNVIRDSIQYNLNLSMTTYNKMAVATRDYAMPVMQNEEWEKILNNISIVSFMQGYDCGLKTYNNYKIVSSTNNEISILPQEIYYVKKEDFSNENAEYHRIDCPKLWDIDNGTSNQYIAFISKEVKYDKLYDKTNSLIPYQYDHKNLACYECINDGNYVGKKIFDDNTYLNLRKAYYIGVGKARNNLYKMNAINNSEGYEIIYDKEASPIVGSHANESKLGLREIKAIEIVLDTIKTKDAEENVLNYKVKTSTENLTDTVYTIVPNVTTRSTIRINVNPNLNGADGISVNDLIFSNQFPQSTAYSTNADGTEKYTGPDYEGDTNFEKKSTAIVKDSILFVKIIYR